MNRRGFLVGLGLVAAPAIIRPGILMPISVQPNPIVPKPITHWVVWEKGFGNPATKIIAAFIDDEGVMHPLSEMHSLLPDLFPLKAGLVKV